MNTVVAYLLAALILIIICAFWGAIFQKAGFSKWWCLAMPIPILNIAVALTLVFRNWPVHRQLSKLRIVAGIPNEDDAYESFQEATKLEVSGKLIEAAAKYKEIIRQFPNTQLAKDAEISMRSIQK